MKTVTRSAAGVLLAAGLVLAAGPAGARAADAARIVFLHHSTGECVWNGGVPAWFRAYNAAYKTRYAITERAFPKESPYGWHNYPYDYWNIWVRHAGDKPYKGEPTLEMLARSYDVIVFKHCFPVSAVEPDTGRGDVTSSAKRIENYKLQYEALRKKLLRFPKVRFIVWTGAALVRGETTPAAARRAGTFFDWVRKTWDRKGDNIYLWDFHRLQTEGGLYLKAAHASGDSHPNATFSKKVAPLLCRRIVDVIRGRGDKTGLTGEGGEPLPAAAGAEPAPAPAPASASAPASVKPPGAGPGRWVFDNAEAPASPGDRWGRGAKYVRVEKGRAVRLDLTAGEEEDWGEYGKHRIVRSLAPKRNVDVGAYRYLALRAKADREMMLVLSLVTLPDPQGGPHQSHFQFSGYLRPKAGRWTWAVYDLSKLELAAEGATAYEAAGKPARPKALTQLKLAVNSKHEKAEVLLDDITFLRDLPASLRPFLQAP